MFASLAFLVAAQQIVIPLGNPPRVERPIAPIETAGPLFAEACQDSDEWDRPAPPVGIFGNTYLVGTCGISAILVTDPAGHVLIDGGTEVGADLIAANIRKLGFRLTDIKYLLISHEHPDHVGGISKLQRMTGAQLITSAAAAPVLNSGNASAADPQYGILAPFPAAHVDRIIRDGEQIRIGNLVVTAISTPGHTSGALSWRWGSCQRGVCRQIVYADSLSPVSRDSYRFSDHPAYLAAFQASIAKIAALDCDILLTPHPSASHTVDRMIGRAPLEDRNACRAYADGLSKRLDDRLAKEAAAK
jgi:metallo-beta-lactamase class B